MKRGAIALALCTALAAMAAGAQSVVVEAVQYPAWLQRGANAVPLAPGMTLEPRDVLRTGGNARVRLRLGEGSTVKLGENARFILERADNGGVFRATLRVIDGAFRFTTRALGLPSKRDVDIKVGLVTAGIRGTDLWGKSSEARDLVCLLEGHVTVSSQGQPEVALAQPLEFYQRPRDGVPEVSMADAAQVAQWARETEMAADGAAAAVDGRWKVIAAKYETRNRALAMSRELRAHGYPAQVSGPEEGIFSVHIPWMSGEMQARALMADLRSIRGITVPKVVEPPGR
jgi:hypothetical protein